MKMIVVNTESDLPYPDILGEYVNFDSWRDAVKYVNSVGFVGYAPSDYVEVVPLVTTEDFIVLAKKLNDLIGH